MIEDPKTQYERKIVHRGMILIMLLSLILLFNVATCSFVAWLIYLLLHG